ncbi:MAG: outer membrane beta-barrel domain-containing protein, partial [Myxococcota bacterium]
WTGIQSDSDLTSCLLAENKLRGREEIANTQQWRANAVAVWSPFYGKLALLQRKLSHFDLNFAAGLGALQLSSPNEDTAQVDTEDSIQVEIVLGAGIRAFLTDGLSVRLDYRQGIVPGAVDEVLAPVEFSLGLSYLLGGE